MTNNTIPCIVNQMLRNNASTNAVNTTMTANYNELSEQITTLFIELQLAISRINNDIDILDTNIIARLIVINAVLIKLSSQIVALDNAIRTLNTSYASNTSTMQITTVDTSDTILTTRGTLYKNASDVYNLMSNTNGKLEIEIMSPEYNAKISSYVFVEQDSVTEINRMTDEIYKVIDGVNIKFVNRCIIVTVKSATNISTKWTCYIKYHSIDAL